MDDEDQNSILYQAMKAEMNPQAELAAMKMIPPGSQYQLGLEMRQGGPGGVVTNPTRMARPPSDFAGRSTTANDNPANVLSDRTFADKVYRQTPIRPSENVVNQYQKQWEFEKFQNMIRQEAEKQAAARAKPNSMFKRGMDWIMGND